MLLKRFSRLPGLFPSVVHQQEHGVRSNADREQAAAANGSVGQKRRSGKHNGIKEIEHTELFLPHSPLFVIAELHLVLLEKLRKPITSMAAAANRFSKRDVSNFMRGTSVKTP